MVHPLFKPNDMLLLGWHQPHETNFGFFMNNKIGFLYAIILPAILAHPSESDYPEIESWALCIDTFCV